MRDFLVQLIGLVGTLYWIILLARAFLPLMGMDNWNPLFRFIFDVTEPVLAPLRRFSVVGMWDLSPVVAMIILTIAQQLLIGFVMSAFR